MTQEAHLRDPRQVIVYDELHEVMPSGGAMTAPVAYSSQKLHRSDSGALWMDEHPPIIDDSGRLVTTTRQGLLPGLPEPRYEGGWVTLGYYASERRGGSGPRLLLRTPLANVVELREKRYTKFDGAGIAFGTLLVGAGTGFAINACVEHGLSPGVRLAEVGLSTLLIAPGLLAIAGDLYSALFRDTDRVLFPPR